MEFITASEIAKTLRMSRQRVYELFRLNVEYGGIPHYEIGNSKRVSKLDFEKWLESQFKGASK